MNFDELLFPHEKVRDIQYDLILKIKDILEKKGNLIVHAPTGFGKTAAVLAPTLKYAIDNKKVVFFLTSRHTQHKIAIDTLKQIKKKYKNDFVAVSIIGKKGLCLQPGVSALYSSEFNEYCRAMREDKKCDFYEAMRKGDKTTPETRKALSDLKVMNPASTEDTMNVSKVHGVCPYEMALLMSREAKVIIGDYYYLFNPDVSNNFLKKINVELEDAIIIVDEGHNLPNRLKDLFTVKLTNGMLSRGIAEAKKFKYEEAMQILLGINDLLNELTNFQEEEKYITKDAFVQGIKNIKDYGDLVADLSFIADAIREEQQRSYIGSIVDFLERWMGGEEGFTRIASKQQVLKDLIKMISYRCLDPSLSTKNVIESAHSTILMSGTLTPTSMYKELLGFEEASEENYKSPFPEENRLNIIIPKTSTKYERRNQEQFKEIAKILATIVNAIPGNSAVFFPSYYLRDQIYKLFNEQCKKTVFLENPRMSKQEKDDLLEKFKTYKDVGAVLLGVVSGSFGEGIDLPGDYLKGVVIVGLPLTKPSLESNALIEYYDKKFGKGWDYGYLFPAFNKTLQSAGRCIRSETDKGVVVFLDERYTWSNYQKLFPSSWNLKTTLLYEKLITDFFGSH